MRRWIVLLLLLPVFLDIPVLSTADDGQVPTHGLIISEHWIDIFQSDDRKEWEVIEHVFYNNTGSDVFNGSLYSWLSDNSLVRSTCCGNAPDMGCRMLEGGAMLCFNIQHYGDNIVYGEPFESYSFMSYYGQTAQLSIVGESQNFSYSDTLYANVTLGQPQIQGDYPVIEGEGIHITSNAVQLGMIANISFSGGMPEKLGLIQPIMITNNGTANDTIELDVIGLPDGWNAVFIHGGGIVRNVTVPMNESEEVVFHIQAPSYMLEVQLNYFIPIEGADDPQADYLFQKEFLYNNSFVEVFIFLLEDDEFKEGQNSFVLLDPSWQPNYERMRHVVGAVNLNAGDRMSFTVAWEKKADYSLIFLGIIMIALAVLIAFLVVRKRRTVAKDREAEEGPKEEESPDVKSSQLEMKKRKILLAIKRLEEDFRAGNIPEDVYTDLRAQYKKSAIDIMKEMDKRG